MILLLVLAAAVLVAFGVGLGAQWLLAIVVACALVWLVTVKLNGVGGRPGGARWWNDASPWSCKGKQARPAVPTHQAERVEERRLRGQGRGDRWRTVNKERARSGEAATSSRLSLTDLSSGRRGGLRSGTKREKGRTYQQLYNEARALGVEGRSTMRKAELERAVDRKRS